MGRHQGAATAAFDSLESYVQSVMVDGSGGGGELALDSTETFHTVRGPSRDGSPESRVHSWLDGIGDGVPAGGMTAAAAAGGVSFEQEAGADRLARVRSDVRAEREALEGERERHAAAAAELELQVRSTSRVVRPR